MAGSADISWISNPITSVVIDAVYPGATAASVAAGSSLSFNHTCNGGNKSLLVLYISVGQTTSDAGITLSATYNSVAMTSVIGPIHSNGGTRGYVQMFRLVNPTSGLNAVQITVTGGLGVADLTAATISFNNVNQVTPLQNTTSATGLGVSPSLTVTSSAGNIVVDAISVGSNISSSTQTIRSFKNLNLSSAGGNGGTSTANGAASVNMGYSVVSDEWAMVGADVVFQA